MSVYGTAISTSVKEAIKEAVTVSDVRDMVPRNQFEIGDDSFLDNYYKPIKIGDITTPLELSTDAVKITGDADIQGDWVHNRIKTNHSYFSISAQEYVRLEGNNAGYIDFYPLAGSSWVFFPSDNFNFVSTDALQNFNFGSLGYLNQVQFDCTNSNYKFSVNEGEGTINDWFRIGVNANGATLLETADVGGTVGHLTLQPDGDLVLDPVTQKTIINATDELYFDGGTHTKIAESSSDTLDITVGAFQAMRIKKDSTSAVNFGNNYHVAIYAGQKLFFDTNYSGHTYMHESADDIFDIYVGGDNLLKLTESGTDGNSVSFASACAGFTQLEPAFDATDTEVDFRHSNKQKLTLTDNCADIHFQFPLVSGNFICVLLQDGTGGRTISNWKTKDNAGNAGAGNSGLVQWAGGTAPTNTETADKADIISVYWDADNEIAYGTYTYNF